MPDESGRGLQGAPDAGGEMVAPNAFAVGLPIVCGVVAAGIFLDVVHPPLRANSIPWLGMLVVAADLMLLAGLASALTAWAMCGLMRGKVPGGAQAIIAAAGLAAVWVPAWLFSLGRPAVWIVIAAGFCALSVNRAVKRYWNGPEVSDAARGGELFAPIGDGRPLVKALLPALGVAVLVQAMVVAMVGEKYLIASLVAAAAVGALVWMYGVRATARSRRDSAEDTLVMVGLAFVLTLVVMLPFLRVPQKASGLEAWMRAPAGAPQVKEPKGNESSGFTGIILLPLKRPEKKITAPPTKSAQAMSTRMTRPLVIPFDGAYWYFKAPYKRPAPSARTVKGSSIKAVISSTDWYPLLMSVDQQLDTPIDLNCCSRIEIELQNGDKRGGPIALELWLRNRGLPGSIGQYVGTAVIPSSEGKGGSAPAEETLEYTIPAGLRSGEFDEITIGVRTVPARARDGAQIAIKEFVLYP